MKFIRMFFDMFLEILWFFQTYPQQGYLHKKNRLVTLSGELLEASGGITGGSKLNKDLAYKFGINNDIDDSKPIKERLLVIEEALKESNNDLIIKNNRLSKLNSNRSQIIEDCASFNKEIEVNQDLLRLSRKELWIVNQD